MAIREFGTIRVTCDNCGRHHDEHVPLDQKHKYREKTEAEKDAENKKNGGVGHVYNYVLEYLDTFHWNESYVREKRKSMKHYLKANKWQVGSGQHVCKVCLDEMTERILETVNDDSGLC